MSVTLTAATAARRHYGQHPEQIVLMHFANGSSPGDSVLAYAPGQSWGGPSGTWFDANAPTTNLVGGISAWADEADARGMDVVWVGYSRIQGSPGANTQTGPPSMIGLEIVNQLRLATAWLRHRAGYKRIFNIGQSAGAVSFAQASEIEDPNGLVMLEGSPTFSFLDGQANFLGAPAYCSGELMHWIEVSAEEKAANDASAALTSSSGEHVPVFALYRDDSTLVNTYSNTEFLAQVDIGLPISGWTNPHDEGGGAVIQSLARSGATSVWYGGPATTDHPTGQLGSVDPGGDVGMAKLGLDFLEAEG